MSQTAETLVLLVVLLAACVLTLYALHAFSAGSRARRALRRFRTTEIAAAEAGSAVKIAGRVGAVGEMLVAPLSGRTCVAYQVVLLRWRRRGVVPSRERVEERVRDFAVDDGTGTALVEAEGATLALVFDWRARDEASEVICRQLECWGLTPERLRWWAGFELLEAVVEPGEVVAVRGILRAGSPVRVSAPDGERLLVSDDASVLDGPAAASHARFRRFAVVAAVVWAVVGAVVLWVERDEVAHAFAEPHPAIVAAAAPRAFRVTTLGGAPDPLTFSSVAVEPSPGGIPVEVRFDATNRTGDAVTCVLGVDLALGAAPVAHAVASTGPLPPGETRRIVTQLWPGAHGFDEVLLGSTLCF